MRADGPGEVEAASTELGSPHGAATPHRPRIDGIGGRTSLSLRPEAIFVNPAAGSCDNIFDARVEELIYMGDHTRVRVDICGNNEFVIKVPRGASHVALETGTKISVGWRSQDCRALDAT